MRRTAGAMATMGSKPAPRAFGSCQTTNADASSTITTSAAVVARAPRVEVRRASPRRSATAKTAASRSIVASAHGHCTSTSCGGTPATATTASASSSPEAPPTTATARPSAAVRRPGLRPREPARAQRRGLVLARRRDEPGELRDRGRGEDRDQQHECRGRRLERDSPERHLVRHVLRGHAGRRRITRDGDGAGEPREHDAHCRHRDRRGRGGARQQAGCVPQRGRRAAGPATASDDRACRRTSAVIELSAPVVSAPTREKTPGKPGVFSRRWT